MSNTEGVSMLSTMEGKLKRYTQQKHEREDIGRELYQTVVHPSIKDYKNIIRMNAIKKFHSKWKTLIYVKLSLVPIFTH